MSLRSTEKSEKCVTDISIVTFTVLCINYLKHKCLCSLIRYTFLTLTLKIYYTISKQYKKMEKCYICIESEEFFSLNRDF